jgi:hypothetical protein
MSETMSLLLATSVLALGGMGLYLFKSNDSKGGSANYDEDEIFKNEKENDDDYDDELNDNEEDYEKKPRKRSGKTKRTKKSSGTKRRY